MMRRSRFAVLVLLALASPATAQDTLQREIRESQARLEQIRREREQLQGEMNRLQSQARDVSSEMINIERQANTSASALRELDFQATALARSVEQISGELVRTRDRLTERRIVLDYRIRSIYKRGPLHSIQVLLAAENFSDLLNRYKYLQLIASYDRLLIEEVSRLERELVGQDRQLQSSLGQLERLRAERLTELARLQQLERQHEQTLLAVRSRERQAAGRLEQLARDEARLSSLVTELERRRVEEERRRVVAGGAPDAAGTITTASLGSLNWPVEGTLIYRFGPQRQPDGIQLRWNGIGIAAPVGTPVRAVEAGTVDIAGSIEGYGPSVVLSHGGGYYTLYLHLQRVNVRQGQTVPAGQVVGTVGGERTREGPHIEFRVHAPGGGGVPVPVDPLEWLRAQSR